MSDEKSIVKGRLRLKTTLGARGLKHDGGIRAVAAASNNAFYASVGDGDRIRLWDPTTGESLGPPIQGPTPSVGSGDTHGLALSDDSRFAFVTGRDVRMFDLETRALVRTFPIKTSTSFPIIAVASHAGLVLYGDEKRPRLFDLALLNEEASDVLAFKNHGTKINACALSNDGQLGLTCGADRTIYLHDLNRAKRKKAKVLATLEGYARSCGFTPDRRLAWTVGWDHVRVFATATGAPTFTLEGPLSKARIGAMSPDGRYLAVAYETEVLIFDIESQDIAKRIVCARAETMTFDHDGRRLLVANHGYAMGEGCAIEVFDVEREHRVLPADEGHIGAVMSMAIPRDRPTTLMSVGVDARVLIWDLESGGTVEQLGPLSAQGHAITTAADGKTLATVSRDGQTLLWDLTSTSSRPIPTGDQGGRQPFDLQLSPDGRFLAYSSRSKSLFFDLRAATLTAFPLGEGHDAPLAFGRDHLYSGANDLVRWHLPETIAEHPEGATCASILRAMSVVPGKPREHVAVATTGGELAVFDATSGHRHSQRFLYGLEILAVAALDEDHVAVLKVRERDTDYRATVVELWGVHGKKPEAEVDLRALEDRARSLVVTPDGRHLCVGTNVGTILVFEVLPP